MPASLDACFFVSEPPEIELRDGLFHVCRTVGGMRFELVMLPSVFARGAWRADQALSRFRAGANVVEIKARAEADEEVVAAH
jgi:diacylglycerol kinase family enzyme